MDKLTIDRYEPIDAVIAKLNQQPNKVVIAPARNSWEVVKHLFRAPPKIDCYLEEVHKHPSVADLDIHTAQSLNFKPFKTLVHLRLNCVFPKNATLNFVALMSKLTSLDLTIRGPNQLSLLPVVQAKKLCKARIFLEDHGFVRRWVGKYIKRWAPPPLVLRDVESLSALTNLQDLALRTHRFSGLKSAAFLSKLTQLTSLLLSGESEITSLPSLELPVRNLTLQHFKVQSLAPLGTLPIETLDLSQTTVRELGSWQKALSSTKKITICSPFAMFNLLPTHLTEVRITNGLRIRALGFVSKLVNLEVFELAAKGYGAYSLAPLKHCLKLRRLRIDIQWFDLYWTESREAKFSFAYLKHSNDLTKLTDLRALELPTMIGEMKDLSFLTSLTSLTDLELRAIKDLKLPEVRENPLLEVSLKPLSSLKHLKRCWLAGFKIQDLRPLKELPLREFDVTLSEVATRIDYGDLPKTLKRFVFGYALYGLNTPRYYEMRRYRELRDYVDQEKKPLSVSCRYVNPYTLIDE